MDKFIVRTKRQREFECTPTPTPTPTPNPTPTSTPISDPGLRPPLYNISKDPFERENIRRSYLIKGPNQPILKEYPATKTTTQDKARRFCAKWYTEKIYAQWLEYSEAKDAVFCLFCYLFAFEFGDTGGGHEAFVQCGFSNWKKKERLSMHIGDNLSVHNKCKVACEDLMNRKKHIDIAFEKRNVQNEIDYRIRLSASVSCIRFLLRQGLAFRGHDESDESLNRGNFLELLKFHSLSNDEIKRVVLLNAPENAKMTSPEIQKQICNVMASLTTKAIIKDIGDSFFSLLVDEARDISTKEQMSVVLRYVNKNGFVIERFLAMVYVSNTTALSLKQAIDSLFATYGLSLSKIRGQGYDGASNMSGRFNGLKSLILAENKSAYYVHCFAHQLQLALIKVAKGHKKMNTFFDFLHILTNVVSSSCKRQAILRETQAMKIHEGIALGSIETGRGLNQEQNLKRHGDTRWNSHYGTILSIISLFPSIEALLNVLNEDTSFGETSTGAYNVLKEIDCFEFAFTLHMMKAILGITFELSQALQRKDQDLLNAMRFVNITKKRLQDLRTDSAFVQLITETSTFCEKYEIEIPKMEDNYLHPARSKRGVQKRSNLHFYKVELLFTVIDSQYQELNDRFDNDNIQLISNMACFNPQDSFAAFNKDKLIELAHFYPVEFNERTLLMFDSQLINWFYDVSTHEDFRDLNGLSELAQKMVKHKKDMSYPEVYLLLTLCLTLPVATATVERSFSAMGLIKEDLRNRLGNEWLNDCLVTYIEKEVFDTIDDEDVLQEFQKMKFRRCILPSKNKEKNV